MSAQEEIGEKEERKIMRSRILGAFREAHIQLTTGAAYQKHCYTLENVGMRFGVNNMVDFILSHRRIYKKTIKDGEEYIAFGAMAVHSLMEDMDKYSTPPPSPNPTTSTTLPYIEWRKTYRGNVLDVQFHYANYVRKSQGKEEWSWEYYKEIRDRTREKLEEESRRKEEEDKMEEEGYDSTTSTTSITSIAKRMSLFLMDSSVPNGQ